MTYRRESTATASAPRSNTWRRDLVAIAVTTVLAAGVFVFIDASEALFHASRRWEILQVDEIPAVLLVLATSLMWFAWRRHRETMSELAFREAAEQRLATLLLENRRLGRQRVELQEAERKRLARELHDEAGQYLNAIKTHAVTIRAQSEHGTSIRQAATAVIDHADRAYEVVRAQIAYLRPVGLDELGLQAALEHCVQQWQECLPQVKFATSFDGSLDDLNESLSLTIFRLTQEGLTNVAKHAHASRVELQIERRPADTEGREEIFFRMTDDGRGGQPGDQRAGVGLVGMRERTEILGGEICLSSEPAKGFDIVARIPIAKAA